MILPLQSGTRVTSRAVVPGFPGGVRFFQLRYGSRCWASKEEVLSVLRTNLPLRTRWHVACLAAGSRAADGSDIPGRGSSREHYREPRLYASSTAEWVWVDVLVDFGEVNSVVEVDLRSRAMVVRGCLPALRRCSGGHDDWNADRWRTPWGGPFGNAYDCEYSMLIAPLTIWRSGDRLLCDVGDELRWQVVDGQLRVSKGASGKCTLAGTRPEVRAGQEFGALPTGRS
jgi:hypothetical protein